MAILHAQNEQWDNEIKVDTLDNRLIWIHTKFPNIEAFERLEAGVKRWKSNHKINAPILITDDVLNIEMCSIISNADDNYLQSTKTGKKYKLVPVEDEEVDDKKESKTDTLKEFLGI